MAEFNLLFCQAVELLAAVASLAWVLRQKHAWQDDLFFPYVCIIAFCIMSAWRLQGMMLNHCMRCF